MSNIKVNKNQDSSISITGLNEVQAGILFSVLHRHTAGTILDTQGDATLYDLHEAFLDSPVQEHLVYSATPNLIRSGYVVPWAVLFTDRAEAVNEGHMPDEAEASQSSAFVNEHLETAPTENPILALFRSLGLNDDEGGLL